MKFIAIISSLLAFTIGTTEACIRVHAYLHNDPYTGDGMDVKIYDGYDFICRGGQHKYFASSDTKWTVKCGEDDRYEVQLTEDGREGTVWNHHANYKATLTSKDHKFKSQCTYKTGNNERCAGNTSTDENTLWDSFGDCDDRIFKVKNCGNGECDISEDDVPCATDYNGRCEPITF